MKKEALEDHLGAVLERSWLVLGAVLGSKSCCGPHGARFFENRLFEEDKRSRRVLDRTWLDLGAKRLQKGGQKGPKRHQKRDQNDIKILIDFWTDF